MKNKSMFFCSWQAIVFGSILIWFMSCNQFCSNMFIEHKDMLSVLAVVLYVVLMFYFVVLQNKREKDIILAFILTGGFLLRAIYVLAAPYDITNHDVGYFMGFDTNESRWGHFGYIEYLYKNHHLPDFDPMERWEFYQPPFFHTVCAVVLGLARLLNISEPLCYEGLQSVSLLCASMTVWACYKILQEFGISDKWLLWIVGFLSIHPFFLIMATSLNNDCMVMCWMALAILCTLRWYKAPTLKNIMPIALTVGLAMFTKLNGAIISFAIGSVFLAVLYQNRQNSLKLLGQFAAFLAVCVPIGLFWPIRNMIIYDAPLIYFQHMSIESGQHIVNQTLGSCFGIPTLQQLSHPFILWDPELERNAWVMLLRTSLYDELQGSGLFSAAALGLLWIGILLAIFMNIGFVWSICKKAFVSPILKIFLIIGYGALLFNYMKYAFGDPFICNMNFRFIHISIIFPCIGAAIWLQNCQKDIIRQIFLCTLIGFMILAVFINLNFVVIV